MFLAHDSGQVIDLVYWRTTNTLGPGSWLMILAWVIGTGYWLMLLGHIFLGPSVPPPFLHPYVIVECRVIIRQKSQKM